MASVALYRRGTLARRRAPVVVGSSPTFITTASNRGFTASNTVPALTGVQVGDILVAFAGGNDQTTSLTPPAGLGWTQIADSAGAVAARMYVVVTTATSANQAGGTWTWPGSHNHEVKIVAYRGGVQPTTAAIAKVTNAGTVTPPTLTSAGANATLIGGSFYTTNGTAPAWPVSMTVRSASAGATASGVISDEAVPTAGTALSRTFNAGGVPAAMSGATVLLEHS